VEKLKSKFTASVGDSVYIVLFTAVLHTKDHFTWSS
jgi:hypothetical protein